MEAAFYMSESIASVKNTRRVVVSGCKLFNRYVLWISRTAVAGVLMALVVAPMVLLAEVEEVPVTELDEIYESSRGLWAAEAVSQDDGESDVVGEATSLPTIDVSPIFDELFDQLYQDVVGSS